MVRSQPGYRDYLAPIKFNAIRKAARRDCPLVYLLSASRGSLVLIVKELSSEGESEISNIDSIWLDSFTEWDLIELVIGRENEMFNNPRNELCGWFGAYEKQANNRKDWLATIERVTGQLWNSMMGPIVSYLKNTNIKKASLIPTGYLSFLPLSASWSDVDGELTKRSYALDHITFAYTPNARILEESRAIANRILESSLMVVNEPSSTTVNPLPNAEYEARSSSLYFQKVKAFQQKQATRESILHSIYDHDVFHFSCHGIIDWDNPLNSGLVLANDEALTLRDFLDLQLRGVRLAILSACETGLPGHEQPDEVVSLPTGLLQAGVAGVIASFWSVSDISTMILLSRFYTLWRDQELPPDEALTQAQRWIRNAKGADIIAHCETFIPELSSPSGKLSRLYRQLQMDYSHPYYWAAFSYMGA